MSESKRSPLLHLRHPEPHVPGMEAPEFPSRMVPKRWIYVAGGVGIAAAFLSEWLHTLGAAAVPPEVGVLWMLPLALLLLAIAIMPFVARHWWEDHYHHAAITLAALVGGYYLFVLPSGAAIGKGFFEQRAGTALAKGISEYLSFIYLVSSLFIVSGGILIRVRRAATPSLNTMFLLNGALLANVLGTTGAAMLLIRPFLRINKDRVRPYHIVFFIFLVANVGGCLTPIGDPPLFLGYLKGIPFWWTANACWPMWMTAVGLLLAIFWMIDTRSQGRRGRAPRPDDDDAGPAISLFGAVNLLLIALIIAGLLLHDRLNQQVGHLPWREFAMIAAACISLWVTPHRIHIENVFNFAPIREIAFLFLGIFVTMVPVLNFLQSHAAALQQFVGTPGQFYFACGALSSSLDNAPTYLAFLEMLVGQTGLPEHAAIHAILADPRLMKNLLAISLGAVFFGAMTYIGNGPNFMVKSIAEHAKVDCPSFFGFIFKYAMPILLPVLVLVWWLFLR